MQNIAFFALVRFPKIAYFDFNKAIDGIATIDSVSREKGGEEYSAHIEFPLKEMAECLRAVISCSGKIIELVPQKEHATAAVRRYTKKSKHAAKNGKARGGKRMKRTEAAAQVEKMRKNLKDWSTMGQLSKRVGTNPNTLYTRIARMKKSGDVETKKQDGKTIYRLAAAA